VTLVYRHFMIKCFNSILTVVLMLRFFSVYLTEVDMSGLLLTLTFQ